jgi:hypothetical protein
MKYSIRIALMSTLALSGCSKQEESCMTVQQLDDDICRVLPTGLVLHWDGGQTRASQLAADGTLEPIGPIDAWCGDAMAHDPERGKLWWVQPSFDDLIAPTLHQFDMASGVQDWQRDLVYDGYRFDGFTASLLAHEGALYFGGRLHYETGEGWYQSHSLLERIDDMGEPVWSEVGYPGHGFSPEDDPVPLEGLDSLIGTSSGVSFLGYITGTDSAAVSAATVDAQTGELLWSTSLDRDNYWSVDLLSGDGESLYVLTGEGGWIERDFETNEIIAFHDTRSDMQSLTPLGEQRWAIDDFVWSKFIDTRFVQAVVGDEVVHLLAGSEGEDAPQRAYLTRRRTSDGDLVCGSSLPEFTELGTVTAVTAHPVPEQLVLEVEIQENDYEVAFLLLQPND